MRCIETEIQDSLKALENAINSNMRCIETVVLNIMFYVF